MYDPAQMPDEVAEERGDSPPSYLSRLTQSSLLSPEEERVLARRARAGDEQAKQRLVETNMRLVVNIAKHYRHRSIPLEDLIQEGAVGLIGAVERFDPDRGFRFSTYATHWIRQTIGRAIDSKSKTIRVPAHIRETLKRIERERARLSLVLGRDATALEICDSLNITPQKMLLALQSAQEPISIDRMVGQDESTDLASLLADEQMCDPERSAITKESRENLLKILQDLSERERKVMRRRLGLDESESSSVLRDVSNELQLSRERIRQIEGQALRKLRAIVKRRKLPDVF